MSIKPAIKKTAPKGAKSKAKFMQGTFNPKHPEKIIGNPKGIVYRSSWEFHYMRELDKDPNVIQWGSEVVVVPYRLDPMPTIRRYFLDFKVVRRVDERIVTQIIEIKPHKETLPPVAGKKRKQTVLNETMTYAMNQAKWKAARIYADKKGWEFHVLTEIELGIKK